ISGRPEMGAPCPRGGAHASLCAPYGLVYHADRPRLRTTPRRPSREEPMRRSVRMLILLACASFAAMPASAQQSYPSKPVRIIVAFPAGGATDVITRAVSQRLSETWGQPIVVENKGGAATQIGTEFVGKATADGYTLLATSDATFAFNPSLYRKLAYD